MSAEIVACVLGGLALLAAGVMEAVGVMGVFGALRFTSCRRCARWTVSSVHDVRQGGPHGDRPSDPLGHPLCLRCRHHEHALAMGGYHAHRPHFGH